MGSHNSTSYTSNRDKCTLDEKSDLSSIDIQGDDEDLTKDQSRRDGPRISRFDLLRAWTVSLCIGITFLNLHLEPSSAIVLSVRQRDPPVPVLDNVYFIAFSFFGNVCNYVECLFQRIQNDRSISPLLLLSAVCAAAGAATLGATALEVLLIFIPFGINGGLTAVYFTTRPKSHESEEMV